MTPRFLRRRRRLFPGTGERIQQLEGMLGECREYFEDCSDVIDGSNGEPAPNREMRLLIEIDEALT